MRLCTPIGILQNKKIHSALEIKTVINVARDEITKLQNELDKKCLQIQQQEYDFQQHDMALRDEINSLSRTIKQLETSPRKRCPKLAAGAAESGDLSHPLSGIDDSGNIEDFDELERLLATEKERNAKLETEKEEKQLAIRDLESIVRTLRAESETNLQRFVHWIVLPICKTIDQ